MHCRRTDWSGVRRRGLPELEGRAADNEIAPSLGGRKPAGRGLRSGRVRNHPQVNRLGEFLDCANGGLEQHHPRRCRAAPLRHPRGGRWHGYGGGRVRARHAHHRRQAMEGPSQGRTLALWIGRRRRRKGLCERPERRAADQRRWRCDLGVTQDRYWGHPNRRVCDGPGRCAGERHQRGGGQPKRRIDMGCGGFETGAQRLVSGSGGQQKCGRETAPGSGWSRWFDSRSRSLTYKTRRQTA
ncbi:hypothetical protein Mpe_B0593 (plasmid) [Methylibium petroleiphilum PM1]|uniref:Uncharacterized protein n=1 Tax=Methylibium petroleiphilum (strain ATCC BAA-1232 / LMG 22953 / PM1) TaxID=420662 RepID=A2SP68_METPP|nr:hypothetical protein Mpe_B0593 [Methylibium petroleiphilum PM1]